MPDWFHQYHMKFRYCMGTKFRGVKISRFCRNIKFSKVLIFTDLLIGCNYHTLFILVVIVLMDQ